MPRRLLLPWLSLLILPASSGAQDYQLSVLREGSNELANYRMQAQVPAGWRFARQNRDRTVVTLSRRLHRGCVAVMYLQTIEFLDLATQPSSAELLHRIVQSKAEDGFRLSGQGALTNSEAAPGGVALSPAGSWILLRFQWNRRPGYLGVGGYSSAEPVDGRHFRVPTLWVEVSGVARCRAGALRATRPVVGAITASAQVIS